MPLPAPGPPDQGFYGGFHVAPARTVAPGPGAQAPDFTLPDAQGKTHSLAKPVETASATSYGCGVKYED